MTGADSVNVVSVFNMIKHFNKAVQGGSHGSHFVNFPGQVHLHVIIRSIHLSLRLSIFLHHSFFLFLSLVHNILAL